MGNTWVKSGYSKGNKDMFSQGNPDSLQFQTQTFKYCYFQQVPSYQVFVTCKEAEGK